MRGFAGILSAGYSALLPPVILICCHLGPTEKVANLPSGTKGRFSRNPVYPRVIDEWATIQPELMDACLDSMACISIDASWLLS
jgi:hypothetical protein